MPRLALRLVLGLLLVCGAASGCRRDPEPKYVLPTGPVFEGELEVGVVGGSPKKPAKSGKSEKPPDSEKSREQK